MNSNSAGAAIVCRTATVGQTRSLAAAVADLVTRRDLLVLVGDLGAGKTAFTQGFAAALGIDEQLTSPTFTLANRYEGRFVLNHLDVYRLEDISEARDLALPELLEDGVTLIEWGDKILPVLPPERLDVRITFGENDDDRRLEFSPVGGGWVERRVALVDRLRAWSDR